MSHTGKIAVAVVIVLLLGYAIFAFDIPYRDRVDDFATCVAAGNPVMESYPRQCRDERSGQTYVEDLPIGSAGDMIRVDFPAPNAGIGSPGRFSGQARGNWFFEASFPIDVLAADGTVLGRGYAEAQGEWMTTEYVPWMATVSFDPGTSTEGVVRFMKDNPSGLPENDAHVDVPVRFVAGSGTTTAACRPTGCSGQICSDQDVVSTCEFRAEYACYQSAVCERQAGGECGWTETAALSMCIEDARDSDAL